MRARLEQHYGETEQQIRNLEQAFEALGERAKGERCPGILGIIEEHDDFKKEEAGSKTILEAFDLGAGLRVEHYEIAAYGSAIALARNLGVQQVVDLLQQNLEQELAMAAFIESAAPMALETARANATEEEARRAARKGGAKKGGAKRGSASKGASKGGAKKAAAKKGAAKGGGSRGGAKKGGAKTARGGGGR
jgi:ferritin-like metal-binding protein YciE